MALVFTDAVLREAASRRRGSERLLDRWATDTRDAGSVVRDQIERGAGLVAPALLPRLLGRLASRDFDQAAAAAGEMLLGLTLHELGWAVDHEPLVDGGTPDLRIRKNSTEFLVEIKQIVGSARFAEASAFNAIERALEGMTVRALVHITRAHVGGQASLNSFRRFLAEAVSSPGEHVFDRDGVLIAFKVTPSDSEWPAYTGGTGAGGWIGDHDLVRSAINEKLGKYRVPLVVALDMVDCLWPFNTVEEVLCGSEVMRIPIDRRTGSAAGPMTIGRATDGIVIRRDRDAERARERLDALLPFEWGMHDDGIRLSARVLANPFRANQADLQVFAPVPRFLVTSAEPGEMTMQLFGEPGSKDEPAWFHRPGFGTGAQ